MKRVIFLIPALLYMGLIFWMSSRPVPDTLKEWPMFWQVKLVHILEYGLLALLLLGGLIRAGIPSGARVALWAAGITFLWGVSDEIHQHFVPGRTAKLADALTDLLAALIAIGVWLVCRWKHKSKV